MQNLTSFIGFHQQCIYGKLIRLHVPSPSVLPALCCALQSVTVCAAGSQKMVVTFAFRSLCFVFVSNHSPYKTAHEYTRMRIMIRGLGLRGWVFSLSSVPSTWKLISWQTKCVCFSLINEENKMMKSPGTHKFRVLFFFICLLPWSGNSSLYCTVCL